MWKLANKVTTLFVILLWLAYQLKQVRSKTQRAFHIIGLAISCRLELTGILERTTFSYILYVTADLRKVYRQSDSSGRQVAYCGKQKLQP